MAPGKGVLRGTLAEQDRAGRLPPLFEAPAQRSAAVLDDVLLEEGWILGVL